MPLDSPRIGRASDWRLAPRAAPPQRRHEHEERWLAPLTGVAFVIVLMIGFLVGGEPPDVKNPPQEIVDHYADNKDSVQIGVGRSR